MRTFENWRPPENLKYNEIYSSSQNDGMVHGCVFGHPTAVVISLVDALAKIVHQFEESKPRIVSNFLDMVTFFPPSR